MDNKTFSKYFKIQNKKVIFIGQSLKFIISQRLAAYGVVDIKPDSIQTLGFGDIIINDTIHTGLNIAALLTMHPSDMATMTEGTQVYQVFMFKKNDVFMENTEVVQNPKLAYIIFNTVIYLGILPKFITYENMPFLFNDISKVTGLKFTVKHAAFEILMSHLWRQTNNIQIPHRIDTSKKPIFLSMHQVAHVAQTATSKITGSHMGAGLDSALVHHSEQSTHIEETLRKATD